MAKPEPIFSRDIFQFFRDLARHNQKTWMDANRERYQECVVRPFRRLLEATSPAVLALDSRIDTAARGGRNVSRINRDIRFAKDKTPYKAHMYLKFCAPFPGDGETGELYAGVSAKSVTAGFRIYAGSKYKESALAVLASPRFIAEPSWAARQRKRLGRRYESYWYAVEKGEWTQQSGFSRRLEENAGVGCPAQATAGCCDSGVVPPANLGRFFETCIRCCDLRLCRNRAGQGRSLCNPRAIKGMIFVFSGGQRSPSECSRHVHIGIEG
jgi:hypothetical protein